ncbi:hypothetical protein OE749_11060 [Aestuariibacter sp. AA17]|uniref:SEA domain-containing protein n=1 Tax=Fluctibacter corallii TaxID=2984329 RepID=A0ABT3A989_9ALTE|nr:hypothetical protein [Aestuariibacter sp. AA17]MCV2885231.1 hypothetical protein [Aestuariibacter sp. AA17]
MSQNSLYLFNILITKTQSVSSPHEKAERNEKLEEVVSKLEHTYRKVFRTKFTPHTLDWQRDIIGDPFVKHVIDDEEVGALLAVNVAISSDARQIFEDYARTMLSHQLQDKFGDGYIVKVSLRPTLQNYDKKEVKETVRFANQNLSIGDVTELLQKQLLQQSALHNSILLAVLFVFSATVIVLLRYSGFL